jgi:hypothetical protein
MTTTTAATRTAALHSKHHHNALTHAQGDTDTALRISDICARR